MSDATEIVKVESVKVAYTIRVRNDLYDWVTSSGTESDGFFYSADEAERDVRSTLIESGDPWYE